jgi:hypothetical protein
MFSGRRNDRSRNGSRTGGNNCRDRPGRAQENDLKPGQGDEGLEIGNLGQTTDCVSRERIPSSYHSAGSSYERLCASQIDERFISS